MPYVHYLKNRKRSLWFLKPSVDTPGSDATIKTEKKFGLKEDHVIVCSECGNPVTAPDFVITVNNHHRHTFINPAGLTYQIGCFSSAEGCIVYGKPAADHTWFPGFAWNYAVCSNCGVHLGWNYQSKDERFFGLILDMLVDAATNQ